MKIKTENMPRKMLKIKIKRKNELEQSYNNYRKIRKKFQG